jgi:hypothetical protein
MYSHIKIEEPHYTSHNPQPNHCNQVLTLYRGLRRKTLYVFLVTQNTNTLHNNTDRRTFCSALTVFILNFNFNYNFRNLRF